MLGPVPGQQVVEPAHGMAVGHALEHVLEIGEGLDVVELGGGEEGGDGRPAVGAAIGSGEQVVLAAERDGADGALDGVVVEFDAAVIEEAAEGVPAGQRIADSVGEAAARRDAVELASRARSSSPRPAAATWMCRTLCRASAVWPRMVASIA